VGVVSNITFRNDDSGYTVVRLVGGVIAVGAMPFVAVGGEYKFYGRFVNHAKHGEQFEIAKYELLPPDNEQKISAMQEVVTWSRSSRSMSRRSVKFVGLTRKRLSSPVPSPQ
jgi:ATP-dependent exoDNAse (exonuclease V) alpha subunit